MKINNYYCGSTDKVSGFLFDTEKKTYKEYELTADKWREQKGKKIVTKDGFHLPCPINYYFRTKYEMELQRDHIIENQKLKKDDKMILDFGIMTA